MDQLTQNVKNQVKQKMKIKDIIDSNVSLGFKKVDVIDRLIIVIGIRAAIIFGSIIGVFLILFASFAIYYSVNQDKNTLVYLDSSFYPDNTSYYVRDGGNGQNIIDVPKITDGESVVESQGAVQRYYLSDKNLETLFELDGFFEGSYFKNEISDVDGSIVMRIGQNMNPADGIVEGYVVEKINDLDTNNISAFIFVDGDWKKKMPQTKIYYGSSYQYQQDFIFTELSPGIYMMEIYDDPNRHFNNFSISSGGIVVGDITALNIINNDVENKTFMRLYS